MVLTLTQDPQVQETNVAVAVVLKLYDLARDSNNTVKLVGSITVPAAYDQHVTFLNNYTSNNSDFTVTASVSYVGFTDSSVESVILANATHAGAGITSAECRTVTNMTNWFKDNGDIDTFDEFPYFSNLTNTTSTFQNSSIRLINLSGLSVIGNNCFNNCPNLTLSSTALQNVTSIGQYAFSEGSYKNSKLVASNLSSLGQFAFLNCSLLEEVDLSGSSFTTLYHGTFLGCNITKIKLPTDVTTIGAPSGAATIGFKSNSDVEVYGLNGVTTINTPLDSCSILNAICLLNYISGQNSIIKVKLITAASIKQLYYPKFEKCTSTSLGNTVNLAPNVTFFSYQAYSSSYQININLLYFKELQEIQKYMFFQAKPTCLVINNITPPTATAAPSHQNSLETGQTWTTWGWGDKIFGNIPVAASGVSGMTIYVPDSAISTYEADSNYNAYPIAGISTLNGGVIYATEQDWIDAGKPNGLIAEYLGYNSTDLATFVSTYNLTYYTPSNS